MGILSKVKSSFSIFLEDRELVYRVRQLTPFWNWIFKVIAASYSVFLIFTAISTVFPSHVIRALFILSITVMVLLKYPAGPRSPTHRPSVIDLTLIGLAIPTFLNFSLNFEQMAWRAGEPTLSDIIFGISAVILVVETCRRAMNVILPMLALFALIYAYFGPYFPGILAHQGFNIGIILQDTYASLNAIFGLVAYVFSAYVVLFIIMGAFFEKIGAGVFFVNLPIALFSRFKGGPAKAAVMASCLFGMISGSATANTVATGTFTIPLMKKAGYRPDIAGAIEPAASTGGMFMPPIMGAAAFIMAEMMRMPYADICRIALVPALLYFFSVFMMVHFHSLKYNVGIIPKEERIKALPIFLEGWYYIIPVLILIYLILSGRTPALAGFFAILSAGVIAVIKGLAKKDFFAVLNTIFQGLVEGGQKSIVVGVTSGPIGIIIGVALLTGIAFKFTSLVLSFAYGLKWMALLLVFFATFVLGMGLTVISDYMILAILAVPAMGEMGIPLIAAHFTAFWYSQSSNVTPPVCIAAFAGAGIAGSKPYRTGINAMLFSAYLYIMPFLFVYTPILMLDGFSSKVLVSWITSFFSTIPFAAAVVGYFIGRLTILQRIALFFSCVLLLHAGILTDSIGLLIILVVGVLQHRKQSSLGSLPTEI